MPVNEVFCAPPLLKFDNNPDTPISKIKEVESMLLYEAGLIELIEFLVRIPIDVPPIAAEREKQSSSN